MTAIVIIDSGGANLASLGFALQRLGASSVVSTEPAVIRAATHVLLPGVGSAGNTMQRLRARGLDQLIPQLTQPVLGICLGMQLLFSHSAEEQTACLGVLPGSVEKLEPAAGRPVPHMGWNTLQIGEADALLSGISDSDYVYFVHSYCAPTGSYTLAGTDYGRPFSSVVRHQNFFGAQFHPERSGPVGARLLANFLACN